MKRLSDVLHVRKGSNTLSLEAMPDVKSTAPTISGRLEKEFLRLEMESRQVFADWTARLRTILVSTVYLN